MRDSTLDKYITNLKIMLDLDHSGLAKFLKMKEDVLDKSKTIPTYFPLKKQLNEQDAKIENYISNVYFKVREFKNHHMEFNDIDKAFKTVIPHPELPNLTTLLDACNLDDYLLTSKVTPFVESICLHYFTEYEIGSRAPASKILNKRIVEEFFKSKVEIKEHWVYSETGDYTILQTQEELEVFQDGTSWWEKIRDFSGDIQQAWILVDKLANQGVQIRLSNKAQGNDYWWCYLSDPNGDSVSQGSSASEAICLAVLDYVNKK